jgi:putative peptidoglycan lipid II flippase
MAGIFSFVINIALAAVLVNPMKGGGVALALSISGAANTAALFVFLNKKSYNNVKSLLPETFKYLLKIILFSVIALIPVLLFNNYMMDIFVPINTKNRFILFAIPLFIALLLFAGTGLLLLLITKDKNIKTLIGIFRRKQSVRRQS